MGYFLFMGRVTRLLRHLGSFALLTGILPSASRLRFDWLSRQFESCDYLSN